MAVIVSISIHIMVLLQWSSFYLQIFLVFGCSMIYQLLTLMASIVNLTLLLLCSYCRIFLVLLSSTSNFNSLLWIFLLYFNSKLSNTYLKSQQSFTLVLACRNRVPTLNLLHNQGARKPKPVKHIHRTNSRIRWNTIKPWNWKHFHEIYHDHNASYYQFGIIAMTGPKE